LCENPARIEPVRAIEIRRVGSSVVMIWMLAGGARVIGTESRSRDGMGMGSVGAGASSGVMPQVHGPLLMGQ
jgi:hypothetical protein